MRPKNRSSDNRIQVENLQDEFREFSSTLFSYLEEKANAESLYDYQKSKYEEVRSEVYLEKKSSGEKISEKHIESMIETDARVKEQRVKMLMAKRDMDTIKNYVESLRSKKDMLIQLGADQRKEK